MDIPVRNFAERTLQRLRPRWIARALYRSKKPQKDPLTQKGATPAESVESSILAIDPDNPIIDTNICAASPGRESPSAPERVPETTCEQEGDIESPHETATFTDGPSRIISAKDGTKECFALLMNHDIVGKLNQIRALDHKVGTLQSKFDDADGDAVGAQIFLDLSEASIANCNDVDEQNRIRKDMDGASERLQKASEKRERIRHYLDIHLHNLAFCRNQWQEMFERVMVPAGLLDAITEEDSVEPGLETSNSHLDEQASEAASDASNDTVISLDQLNRMATYEKVQKTEDWLHQVQDKFDARRTTYNNEWCEYRQAVEDGTCSVTQSTFDRMDLLNVRHQTFLLIDAEAAYEHAKSQARALGINGNDLDQESDFVDDVEDGEYLESLEAELLTSIDRDFIEGWCTEVSDDEDEETLKGQDSDEWDAKTVDISDSISLVDRGRNRRRIDRWQEICGL